jgi:hypothetical protein
MNQTALLGAACLIALTACAGIPAFGSVRAATLHEVAATENSEFSARRGGVRRGAAVRRTTVVRRPAAVRRTTVARPAAVRRTTVVRPAGAAVRRTTVVRPAAAVRTNVVVRPVRPWVRRAYYGTIVGGIALGTIIAATTVGFAPAAPGPNMCWFWADSTQTQGYWDYCTPPQ